MNREDFINEAVDGITWELGSVIWDYVEQEDLKDEDAQRLHDELYEAIVKEL